MPEGWNATRIAVECQRLTGWERDLAEREAALKRGRLAFYSNLEKRPWVWRQVAAKALFPDLVPGEVVVGQCPNCGAWLPDSVTRGAGDGAHGET